MDFIKESNADSRLTECFGILSKPIISNIKVTYSNKNVKELTQKNFNALYDGNDIIFTRKIANIQNIQDFNLSATITAITGKKTRINKGYRENLGIFKIKRSS